MQCLPCSSSPKDNSYDSLSIPSDNIHVIGRPDQILPFCVIHLAKKVSDEKKVTTHKTSKQREKFDKAAAECAVRNTHIGSDLTGR